MDTGLKGRRKMPFYIMNMKVSMIFEHGCHLLLPHNHNLLIF